MSQEFPTTSLDITKDFHILHNAYVCIHLLNSILKAKTYTLSLVWQTAQKTDAFTELGEPAIRAACTPQTMLDRHF